VTTFFVMRLFINVSVTLRNNARKPPQTMQYVVEALKKVFNFFFRELGVIQFSMSAAAGSIVSSLGYR
jgi:hypothetical protein